MLKAIVFDMDETLLDINLSAFIAVLVREEAGLIARIGRVSPLKAVAAYGSALMAVNATDHDGERTNRQIFDNVVRERTGVPLDDPVIADAMEYYEREVLPHRNDRIIHARPMPGGREAVLAAHERGLRVALLTNPSFSRACIETRMGWGDLTDLPFELVTVMENSRHCKPTASYYRESLAQLGLDPTEALMVGNDPKRDFAEPGCGLTTAYVGGGEPERACWCGSMADFASRLDEIIGRFAERERLQLD